VVRAQRGITLIEILIAMLLGLIVSGVLAQSYINNKQAFRAQNSLAQLQDQLRFISASFEADMMLAGHWGPIEWDAITKTYPAVTGQGGCDAAWIFKGDAPIEGYDGANTLGDTVSLNGLPANCVSASDYMENSDIVVVRHVVAKPSRSKHGDGSLALANHIYLRALVGGRGQFFLGTQPNTLPTSLYTNANADAPGYFNYRYEPSMYYVRRCRTKAVSTSVCSNAADGGTPIPSLVRLTLDGQVLREELMVEGVERLQMEYGIDVNADLLVDCWLTASAVRNQQTCAAREGAVASFPARWQNVVAARMHVLVRATEREGAYADTQTYTIGDQGYTPAGGERHYRRRNVSKIVQVRNYPRG
jgi:type IV pilus assembly protein PilW